MMLKLAFLSEGLRKKPPSVSFLLSVQKREVIQTAFSSYQQQIPIGISETAISVVFRVLSRRPAHDFGDCSLHDLYKNSI